MQRIAPIATQKERADGRFGRPCRSRQTAPRGRDLGFGHPAARTCGFLVPPERARRSPQQPARPRMLAELCHGDAAQRERRRIVAQRDPLQGAERISGRERPRRRRDQGVHSERLPPSAGSRRACYSPAAPDADYGSSMSTENRMNPDLPMPVAPPTGSVRRFTVAALLSALAGLLVPQCPLCLPAYLSAAGVGVSFGQGAAPILLRVANGVVATALSWLAARVVLRLSKNAPPVLHPS